MVICRPIASCHLYTHAFALSIETLICEHKIIYVEVADTRYVFFAQESATNVSILVSILFLHSKVIPIPVANYLSVFSMLPEFLFNIVVAFIVFNWLVSAHPYR